MQFAVEREPSVAAAFLPRVGVSPGGKSRADLRLKGVGVLGGAGGLDTVFDLVVTAARVPGKPLLAARKAGAGAEYAYRYKMKHYERSGKIT